MVGIKAVSSLFLLTPRSLCVSIPKLQFLPPVFIGHFLQLSEKLEVPKNLHCLSLPTVLRMTYTLGCKGPIPTVSDKDR